MVTSWQVEGGITLTAAPVSPKHGIPDKRSRRGDLPYGQGHLSPLVTGQGVGLVITRGRWLQRWPDCLTSDVNRACGRAVKGLIPPLRRERS